MTSVPDGTIRYTESVCPVCLDRIPARHVVLNGDVYLKKTCELHGDFSTVIWRGGGEPYYSNWIGDKSSVEFQSCEAAAGNGCPYDCGLCSRHRQKTCCVLLEVTGRCNLNCSFCFAKSRSDSIDPSFEKVREWLQLLAEGGRPFIHISGGEPTVREDLPEIINLARNMDFPYIQLNTNGLRLARESGYAGVLKEAGLSSVFMQFDGTRDDIYMKLRGKPLLKDKEQAIKNCGHNYLGVVLVPTIVPGVNADNIGETVRFGLARSPDVRGIHFQPVSYFGRYPEAPLDSERITLPEVIRQIEKQTDGLINVQNFAPSGCDHARCGFHGDFVVMPDSGIRQLTHRSNASCCCKGDGAGAVERNRNFVARRWERKPPLVYPAQKGLEPGVGEWEAFVERVKTHGFSITGMAFQDCWNLDLERLQECSLHVMSPDGRVVTFCAYNLSSADGSGLYRGE